MAGVDKLTHFGRAGEFYAMSELLLRGWNVAVPVIDVGDDVFVIDDSDKTSWRVQVKSTPAEVDRATGRIKASFTNLRRSQLRSGSQIDLVFVLMIRLAAMWRFLAIPRARLLKLHRQYLAASAERSGPGRPPKTDDEASTDKLSLEVLIEADQAVGWGHSLTEYLDVWPEELGVRVAGPGRRDGRAIGRGG